MRPHGRVRLPTAELHGSHAATPLHAARRDPAIVEEPAISLTSGYVQRASAILPKQGSKKPWRLYQNYMLDLAAVRFGTVDDGTMVFGRPGLERPSA